MTILAQCNVKELLLTQMTLMFFDETPTCSCYLFNQKVKNHHFKG